MMVGEMFDRIAPTYDRLNHLLSLGIDRGWRRKLVAQAEGVCLLDVATGTGDVVLALARKLPIAEITGVDISEGMLAIARKKAGAGSHIKFLTADAEALPFPDRTFDCVTVAFGVRNFGDVEAGLREMCRVLKDGGRCLVLEFSEPRGVVFGPLYRWYFHRVLPWVGRVVSRDRQAYSYLPRSVGDFPTPERFTEMLLGAGFAGVEKQKLTFGVSYLYIAKK